MPSAGNESRTRPRPRPRRSLSSTSRLSRPETLRSKALRYVDSLMRWALRIFLSLTPLQRIGAILMILFGFISAVLSIVYHEQIFRWLTEFARSWRSIPGGWLILWTMTFVATFPPLPGYSTAIGLGGFVYGFPNGWFITASASTIGATFTFLICRYVFHDFVERMVAKEPRFAALALTLKHDGLKLLIMIRLCPLPFSFANAALSTIPTIHAAQFFLATAIASPKLALHVWIGAQMSLLAEQGDKLDPKTKAVSYIGIVLGSIFGAVTGWWIYKQTKKRSQELQELEEAESGALAADYADDDDLADAAAYLREDEDDISLRDTDWDEPSYQDSSGDSGGSGTTSPPQVSRR